MKKYFFALLSSILSISILCSLCAFTFTPSGVNPETQIELEPRVAEIAEPRTTVFGPYNFNLPTYGMVTDLGSAFPQTYLKGTKVTMKGIWFAPGNPLFFVFSGKNTKEVVSALVYSDSPKTLTLPVDDEWKCFVECNAGPTYGTLWIETT